MNDSSWHSGRQRQARLLLWCLVLIGVLAALVGTARRWQAESRNRKVEITLDFAEVEKLAEAAHQPLDEVLQRLRRAGVTSVALQEDTLAQLEEQRSLAILPARTGRAGFRVDLSDDPADPLRRRLATMAEAIRIKSGVTVDLSLRKSGDPEIDVPYAQVRSIGLGLDPAQVEQIRRAGLDVVGRIANYNGVLPEGIAWSLGQLKSLNLRTVIFSGDEMLGYKGYLTEVPPYPTGDSTAALLVKNDLNLGIVEFGKQKGEAALAKVAQERVIRVHTVTGAEMAQADIPTNLQRFLLGARERNIRLLYVRLFPDEKSLVEANATYIEQIVAGLDRGGLAVGPAHGYAPLTTPSYLRALIGLGLAAGFLLLIDSLTGVFAGTAPRGLLAASVVGAIVLCPLPVAGETGAKLAALVAGCLFPTLAVLNVDPLRPSPERNRVAVALARFAAMCAITGAGILAVVGLLADRLYLIKAETFLGVKATLIVPLLVVTVVCALGLRARANRTFAECLSDARGYLTDLAMKPVFVWQVLLTGVSLAAVALILLRSGNDPGIGISPMELKLRSLLDSLLYARPRFKEMFGHGVLLLGLLNAAEGRRHWALPLVIIGTVGQASLLNTFCHLHTPLVVGLWRAVLGIAIGVVGGLFVHFALRLARLRS
ncbi:MAG: DUF5693 family protein [Capsulimonadales bacterium]|nr:DUF5693 family protein [Capsulimonadales bacterium]